MCRHVCAARAICRPESTEEVRPSRPPHIFVLQYLFHRHSHERTILHWTLIRARLSVHVVHALYQELATTKGEHKAAHRAGMCNSNRSNRSEYYKNALHPMQWSEHDGRGA
jgi:hypothetical protein